MAPRLRHRTLITVAAAALLAGPVPLAGAHDAPMPPGAGHGQLPNERWVNYHWAPMDEAQTERELHLEPGQLQAYLYNDHHTLAQLARQRGIAFEPLVRRLAAWTDDVPRADKAEIEQRIRLTLVSGHLAQHLYYHVFHGLSFTSTLVRAAEISEPAFRFHRGRGWSYDRMITRAGNDPQAVERTLAAAVDRNQLRGVALGVTPHSEAHRLAALQKSRLACWLSSAAQYLDVSAPYDRRYTKHDRDHTSADVPTTRAGQRVEDRLISKGLAGRPPGCWDLPQQFHGDPGAPLSRRELRRLARVPGGFEGPINDSDAMAAMPGM